MSFVFNILIVFGILLLLYFILLDGRRTRALRAFARIEAQLRRRQEAISAILEAAGRSPGCDTTLIREIALLHAIAEQLGADRASERFGIEAALQERIERLLQTVQSVPGLGTDEAVQQAQMRYAEVHARIGAARARYNGAAEAFNGIRRLWPFSVLSRALGARPLPLFRLDKA